MAGGGNLTLTMRTALRSSFRITAIRFAFGNIWLVNWPERVGPSGRDVEPARRLHWIRKHWIDLRASMPRSCGQKVAVFTVRGGDRQILLSTPGRIAGLTLALFAGVKV